MDGVQVTGAQMRREILGGILPAAGIVQGLAAVALPTPAMKVRLPAGLAAVDDGQGGYYPVVLTTQTDLDIAASSATQARIDSVIAQVLDNGNATSTYVYRVITGTPSGSPVAPTLPPADATGAVTLRVANVFVQINAETNGFVRAQDVTVVAPSALLVPRPVERAQTATISNTEFTGTVNTWTDLPTAKWQPLTFVVPPSGQVYVTLSANVGTKDSTSSATTWASWRGTGGGIASGTASTLTDPRGVSARENSRCFASKRVRVTGLTAGASVTLTPIYFLSTTPGAGSIIGQGTLIVEPIA
jgi:hypothetical protein